jgi:hypothetical protein
MLVYAGSFKCGLPQFEAFNSSLEEGLGCNRILLSLFITARASKNQLPLTPRMTLPQKGSMAAICCREDIADTSFTYRRALLVSNK